MLTMRGERKHESKVDDDNYYRFESSRGSFVRHIPLPKVVKADSIQATYENGVLEVVVPKAFPGE
jgi:HSP20 family protein